MAQEQEIQDFAPDLKDENVEEQTPAAAVAPPASSETPAVPESEPVDTKPPVNVAETTAEVPPATEAVEPAETPAAPEVPAPIENSSANDVPMAATDDQPSATETSAMNDTNVAGDTPAAPEPVTNDKDNKTEESIQQLIEESPAPMPVKAEPERQPQATLPTRQYLDQMVVPILHEALSQLVKHRPADPIQYVGDYLLKHKEAFTKSK